MLALHPGQILDVGLPYELKLSQCKIAYKAITKDAPRRRHSAAGHVMPPTEPKQAMSAPTSPRATRARSQRARHRSPSTEHRTYRPRHQTFPWGRDRTARPGERCRTCSENSLAPQVPGPIFPNHGTPAGSPSVENQPLLPGAGPGPSVPHGGPTPGLSGQAGVRQEGRITMEEILRWMTVEGTNPTVMSSRTC